MNLSMFSQSQNIAFMIDQIINLIFIEENLS